MKLKNRNKVRKAERQASAAVRQAEHAVLTPQQKLAKLDQRLGAGVGAKSERERLAKQIEAGFKPKVTKETAEAIHGVTEQMKSKKGKGRARQGQQKKQ